MSEEIESYKDFPGYQNLSEEQKAIADQWDKERAIQFRTVSAMFAAKQNGNEELYKSLHEEYEATVSDFCVHERSIWSNCGACDEIEKIVRGLNPDEDFPEEDE